MDNKKEKTSITLYLDADLIEKLRKKAISENRSVSSLVNYILDRIEFIDGE